MTDHIQTIRAALSALWAVLGESSHTFAKERAIPLLNPALAALTALQEERERMCRRWQFIEDNLHSVEFLSHHGVALLWKQGELGRTIDAAMEPAPQFNRDEKWLREKAALEDGCFVSVGGLVTDLESPAAPQEAAPASTEYACNNSTCHLIGVHTAECLRSQEGKS